MSERIACVGHDVWVGGYQACDDHGGEFSRIVHIWHEYQGGKWLCHRRETCGDDTLTVRYSDGDSLARASCPIDSIAEFCVKPGRLLVHCAWGSYRSPTLAIVAKVSRGCGPFEAVADITRGLWSSYRQAPHLHDVPLAEILAWATKR